MPKGKPIVSKPRVFNDLKSFARWVIGQAKLEQSIADKQPNAGDQQYYNGKASAYNRIGYAIDRGLIVINLGVKNAANGEESPAETSQTSDRPRSDEPDTAG